MREDFVYTRADQMGAAIHLTAATIGVMSRDTDGGCEAYAEYVLHWCRTFGSEFGSSRLPPVVLAATVIEAAMLYGIPRPDDSELSEESMPSYASDGLSREYYKVVAEKTLASFYDCVLRAAD